MKWNTKRIRKGFHGRVFDYLNKRYKIKGNVLIITDGEPNVFIVDVFGEDAYGLYGKWIKSIEEQNNIKLHIHHEAIDTSNRVYLYEYEDDAWYDSDFWHYHDDYDDYEDMEGDLRSEYGFDD